MDINPEDLLTEKYWADWRKSQRISKRYSKYPHKKFNICAEYYCVMPVYMYGACYCHFEEKQEELAKVKVWVD